MEECFEPAAYRIADAIVFAERLERALKQDGPVSVAPQPQVTSQPTVKPAVPSPAQPVGSVATSALDTYPLAQGPAPTTPRPTPAKVESTKAAGWIGTKAGDRKVLRLEDQEIAFRWCPPGSFKMGDERVDVTLTKGFWMMETRVTQGLWRAAGGIKLHWSFAKGPNLPVFNVNHEESEDFAVKSTKLVKLPEGWKLALPTEAQWEFAARAGTTSTYFFGEDVKLLGVYAWFRENSGGKPHEVGTTRRGSNPWGLHDMLGNVWEWRADWYDDKLCGGDGPRGPSIASDRLDRGGSWDDDAGYCRSADRDGHAPEDRNFNLGFRLAAGQE